MKTERVVVEPWVGGRIFETMSDGSEGSWGTILVWDAPHRLVMAWKPNRTELPPTEVEIQFIEQDDGRTRVDLEHRGWERLGDLAAEARPDTARTRAWTLVFEERFASGRERCRVMSHHRGFCGKLIFGDNLYAYGTVDVPLTDGSAIGLEARTGGHATGSTKT